MYSVVPPEPQWGKEVVRFFKAQLHPENDPTADPREVTRSHCGPIVMGLDYELVTSRGEKGDKIVSYIK